MKASPAWVEVHESMLDCPTKIAVGLAVIVTAGTRMGVTVIVTVFTTAPPWPVAVKV